LTEFPALCMVTDGAAARWRRVSRERRKFSGDSGQEEPPRDGVTLYWSYFVLN